MTTGLIIGQRQGIQQTLYRMYAPSNEVVSIEEKRGIFKKAREEAGERLPCYYAFIPAAVFFTGCALGVLVEDRQIKKKNKLYAIRGSS